MDELMNTTIDTTEVVEEVATKVAKDLTINWFELGIGGLVLVGLGVIGTLIVTRKDKKESKDKREKKPGKLGKLLKKTKDAADDAVENISDAVEEFTEE